MTRRAEKLKQLRLAQAANREGKNEEQMAALRAYLELCSLSDLQHIDAAIKRIEGEEASQ
ncbi:hypothetical protein [Aureimonas psammosilenae]|uniref:hypothetical protein n=1 Tax=Aureimonas psammosilenae TaxID=2495496 RepID=UPI0012609FAC|nr:hypothetical protein [Aureimonas psammosilenae]